MKIETSAQSFCAAMNAIAPAIERRSTIPVLGCMKISDGRLYGTNLDMQASVSLPMKNRSDGAAVVEFGNLNALIKHVDGNENVVLNVTDELATVCFNGAEYGALQLPTGDFPEFDGVSGNAEMTSTGNLNLLSAFRAVRFAVSSEETRYYLNGICLGVDKDGQAVAVATDGHRLAVKPLASSLNGANKSIVPSRAIDYLLRQKGEPNSVLLEGLRARFDFDGFTLDAKLIDGTYPDWERVVPADVVKYVTLETRPLKRVLKRVTAYLGGKQKCIVMTVSGNRAQISGADTQGAAFKETMQCEADVFGEFKVGYNSRYLVDILTAYSGCETISLSAKADELASAPTLITSSESDLKTVLMPMRI